MLIAAHIQGLHSQNVQGVHCVKGSVDLFDNISTEEKTDRRDLIFHRRRVTDVSQRLMKCLKSNIYLDEISGSLQDI